MGQGPVPDRVMAEHRKPPRRPCMALKALKASVAGKRRHVWGPIPGQENTSTGDASTKKRKRRSRWGEKEETNDEKAIMLMPNEIVLSNGMKVYLPPSVTGRSPTGDPEVLVFHQQLNALNKKISEGEIDIPPEGERSPSPPPTYDAMGIRLNTREVRYREKMQRKRNELIETLIARDPTYRPPSDYRPEKKWCKLSIPHRQYPGYNFIGLIIGPRGNTQQRMQAETNTKIAIRGRGSIKDGTARDSKGAAGEDEDLHVMITGDRQEDVDAARRLVERLLKPLDEEMNEHKRIQLRELAAMNGTLKDTEYCTNCAEPGHNADNCPKSALDVFRLPDQIAARVEEQYARDVARMNPGESGKMEQEFSSFLAELGGTDPRAMPSGGAGFGGGPSSRAGLGSRSRPGDDLPDSCKLYIGNLSKSMTEDVLRDLFSVHGNVLHAAVPRDMATGLARGFGFITFPDDATAAAARRAMDGHLVDDLPLIVRMKGEPSSGPAFPMRRGGGPSRPDDDLPPENKLYVGSLPPSIDDAALQREFERFGPIASCRVIYDRDTNRPRGYAFVNFVDTEAARAALFNMNGFTGFEGGRPINVKISGQPTSPLPSPVMLRGPSPTSVSDKTSRTDEEGFPVLVDGALARVHLDLQAEVLSWTLELGGPLCCAPGQRSTSLPVTEILAVEMQAARMRRAHALVIYTFQRSPSNPSCWHPRQVTFTSPNEAVLRAWEAAVRGLLQRQAHRPRHLLVIVNPYGGSRLARATWATTVRPVLAKAGVRCTTLESAARGHAADLVRRHLEALEAGPHDPGPPVDGLLAVGGDGLFHEMVNALLAARLAAGGRSRRLAALRLGHVPAGSTDAVACTLNGTRSAFTAAMHVALGDQVPLDVLRIDTAQPHTEFAVCMASYGFMGDLMAESEGLRWLGPLRYEVVGARMLAANRSYRARLSYLPPPREAQPSFTRACRAGCDACRAGWHPAPGDAELGRPATVLWQTRRSEWVTLEEEEFAGFMMVVMPCRSDKSKNGVAKYGHLSDGKLHLVVIKRCSRLMYLRFLLRMAHIGLEAGGDHGDYIKVIPALAVRIEPIGKESQWNVDGELLPSSIFTAQLHRGAVDVFARGVDG
ncbi:hypothetical protein APUTEX25_001349 [Auxenochlorella protothecoides]|uniref:Branchpoint-bridging protein n=1 Tax=Auxenochlorella protothecoides TaxID=3075 RepID=A0A3M7L4M9_AUXPR|nr:hypothetical protein APUTEX25_001349 [Auxenochlorella protothecoides]|eukprot:RMZ56502.1 hypothetical protein APUTEX25_001349 [Auxenochlorella protothecoides]